MKVTTAEEMRNCDSIAINQYGIPGLILMENAGMEVFRQIDGLLDGVSGKKICILSGKGNNGGDGYVLARHLYNQGAVVKVYLLGTKEEVVGDAAVNLNILDQMGINITEVNKQTSRRGWDRLNLAVKFSDCVVDALLGTGFKGEITGDLAMVIDIINNSGHLVVAVDIPSGVEANTGNIGCNAVKADYTVTLALPKPGLLLYPGALYAGKVVVADISIPADILKNSDIKQNMSTLSFIKQLLPKREKNAHKGMSGRVTVVAGSRGLGGAACLTATGALKSGAGLITLAGPENLAGIMAVKLTEVMTKSLPETIEGTISEQSLPDILSLAQNSQVLAIGPGLGREATIPSIIEALIKTVTCPMVIDADALNALERQSQILRQCATVPVLTPHPQEMARLTGMTVDEINSNRIEVARRFSVEWNSIIVLKGAATVIALPDGEMYINTTGNEGMATGGTGDALTGIIAGLIAQGLNSFEASVAGVYIHGLAGDIAAKKGTIGLTATNLLEAVPAAISTILE